MSALDQTAARAIARSARTQGDALTARAVDRVAVELALDLATRRNLEVGIRAAVDRFITIIEHPDDGLDTALYVAHGRAQSAAGRSLRELLSIYRISGLVLWESMTAMPETARLSAAQALELGGRWLLLIETLSVAAVDGYLEEGAQQRRRDRARRDQLRSLLLSEPPVDDEAIESAAARAGWLLAPAVRVAVSALPADADPADAERAPARVLAGPAGAARLALIVADDEDAERLLTRAAAAHGARGPIAIGPSVPAREAARSLRRAASLLDEVEAGRVHGAAVVHCDQHEVALIVRAAPELLDSLVERRLAPLHAVPEGRRDQVASTLAAWLDDPHRPQAIADRLGVHVGTIRYRLGRLRELFGDDLDDPGARFELQLALRAWQSRTPPGDAS